LLAGAGLLVLVAAGLAFAAFSEPSDPLVLPVDGGPTALAISGGNVWVATPRTGAVVALDADTGGPAGPPLRTGGAPARLAPARSGLWVADAAAGVVFGVHKRRVLPAVRVGADASDVALAGGAVWTASSADGRVYVHDGSGTSPLRAGRSPVALAADDARVFAADSETGTLTILDARTRKSVTIAVGGAAVDVALDGDTAWVADAAGDRIAAVRGGAVRSSVPVGDRPVALATAGEDVYVVTAGERRLLRVRDGKVRSSRPLDGDPAAVAVDRAHVWVALPSENHVLRFDR